MRFFLSLIFSALTCGGGYMLLQNPDSLDQVRQWFNTGEFLTLELRHSPKEIMERNKEALLKGAGRKFLEPSIVFYPYLLLEVKYTNTEEKTQEGLILWGLEDGEMVLSTSDWSKTHGFEDCLLAGASRYDFKILNTLASSQKPLDREQLLQKLLVEDDTLDHWLESAKDKYLIVQSGNQFRLHFENPKIFVKPETMIEHRLVTKPSTYSERMSKRYSMNQIENISKAAFGSDFTIRSSREVYLPVVRIKVQNPDNSIAETHWNALNGKKISDNLLP